jgi:hypothetical protein
MTTLKTCSRNINKRRRSILTSQRLTRKKRRKKIKRIKISRKKGKNSRSGAGRNGKK